MAHGAVTPCCNLGSPRARYVYKDCLPRFEKFAMNVMQVDPEGTADDVALRGIEAMEDFYREIKMPTSIHELGIDPGDDELKLMAHKCSIGCKGKRRISEGAA
ncbi:MAG: iron-containing alcohol dehydrogenase [Coprococcus sp.]